MPVLAESAMLPDSESGARGVDLAAGAEIAPASFNHEDPILSWLKPLFTLWLVFATLHIAQLSNLSLSIDNEFTAVGGLDFLITQGRWGSYLVNQFLPPMPLLSVPFFPLAVYGLLGAAAYLVAIFSVTGRKPNALAYLLFPLFIAHPVLQFLEFFSVNITSQGVALLMAWTCALCYSKIENFGTRSSLLATGAVLCGCLSISTYQANTLLLVCCLLIVAIARLVRTPARNSNPAKVFGGIGLIMAGSLFVYKLIADCMMSAFNVDKAVYLDCFFHPLSLLNNFSGVIATTLSELISVYSIAFHKYGVPGDAIAFLMAASVVIVLGHFVVSKSKWNSKLLAVSLVGALLFAPLSLNLISNGVLPLRCLVGVPMTYWFLVFLAMQFSNRTVQRIGYLSILAAILASTYMASFYAAGDQIARAQDQRTADAIVRDIEKLVPDFRANSSQYSILPYGQIATNHPYMIRGECAPAWTIFEYEGGNPHRILTLMKVLGLATPHFPAIAEMKAARPTFEKMSVWPQDGSIRVNGKAILLKLSPPNAATDQVLSALEAQGHH